MDKQEQLMTEEEFLNLIHQVWSDEGWVDDDDDGRTPSGAEGSLLVEGMERLRNFYEGEFTKLRAMSSEQYTATLVNAIRLSKEDMSRLVKDLVDRGAEVPQEPIRTILDDLKKQTAIMSVLSYAMKKPNALKLMLREDEAIPVILSDMRDGAGTMLHVTLLETMRPHMDVYDPEDVGAGFKGYDVKKAVESWVQWGISNHIIEKA